MGRQRLQPPSADYLCIRKALVDALPLVKANYADLEARVLASMGVPDENA